MGRASDSEGRLSDQRRHCNCDQYMRRHMPLKAHHNLARSKQRSFLAPLCIVVVSVDWHAD